MAYRSNLAVDQSRFFIARVLAAGLLLLSSGLLYGQATAAPAAPHEEMSTAVPALATPPISPGSLESDRLVLRDGEPVLLRTIQRLSSEEETNGDAIQFEVADPVKAGDLIVVPEHAMAVGKITRLERKRRRGIPGKMEISIDRVRLVNGEWAPLRAVQRKSGKGTGGEIAGNMVNLTVNTYLVGAPLAPLFLLQHGKELVLPEGSRFTAYIHGDVALDRAAVLKAQSLPEMKRTDVGTVFIYRPFKDPWPHLVGSVTCGEADIGIVRPGQFIRLELPPGQYWFRAGGEKIGMGLRSPAGEYLAVNVAGGKSYYLRMQIVGSAMKIRRPQLDQIESIGAAREVWSMDPSAERSFDDSWMAENVSKLQAMPKQKDSQQPERHPRTASQTSTPQDADQLDPGTLFGQ